MISNFAVDRVRFNYRTQNWESDKFDLPYLEDSRMRKQYILLVPKDILTQEENWINKSDLF